MVVTVSDVVIHAILAEFSAEGAVGIVAIGNRQFGASVSVYIIAINARHNEISFIVG
jgi:hypothetical protein